MRVRLEERKSEKFELRFKKKEEKEKRKTAPAAEALLLFIHSESHRLSTTVTEPFHDATYLSPRLTQHILGADKTESLVSCISKRARVNVSDRAESQARLTMPPLAFVLHLMVTSGRRRSRRISMWGTG